MGYLYKWDIEYSSPTCGNPTCRGHLTVVAFDKIGAQRAVTSAHPDLKIHDITSLGEADPYAKPQPVGMSHNGKATREWLEARYQAYTLDELRRYYEVRWVRPPYVIVRRHSDGQLGSMESVGGFPALYFNFVPDAPAYTPRMGKTNERQH